MKKAFQNSLFLSGLPLAVFGVAITAPGLWIPGLVLMVAGLATKKEPNFIATAPCISGRPCRAGRRSWRGPRCDNLID